MGNALTSTNVTYSRQQPLHPAGLQAPGAAALLPPSVPGQVCRSLGLTLCCPLVFPGRSAGPWGQRCAAPWCSFSFIEKSSTPLHHHLLLSWPFPSPGSSPGSVPGLSLPPWRHQTKGGASASPSDQSLEESLSILVLVLLRARMRLWPLNLEARIRRQ